MPSQGAHHICDESILLLRCDVLNHIKGESTIASIRAKSRLRHVMHRKIDRPSCVHGLSRILDKDWIEIDGRHFRSGLPHDPRPESIGTTDLQHAPATGQHLGGELVTREDKYQSLRIILPSLTAHQTEA